MRMTGALGLGAFAPNSSRQLHVLRHDGDPLGVNGAEVGVFEQGGQVGLCGFLESEESGCLEANVPIAVFGGDLPHQPLEGQLANEEVRPFLVSTDLS